MAAAKPPGGDERRTESEEPNPVDLHVGTRIRLRRVLLGMSQQELGKAVGLTFQQVQKYERGANRVAASRLYDLSRVLGVPLAFFFDKVELAAADAASGSSDHGLGPVSRETLELVRAYYRIDPPIRQRLFELTRAIARACDENA